jgi:hypothetical protein
LAQADRASVTGTIVDRGWQHRSLTSTVS